MDLEVFSIMIAHQFACFVPHLVKNNKNIPFSLEDESIIHRLKNVLRLEPGESIMLFNRDLQATFEIREFLKKSIQGTLSACQPHEQKSSRKVTVFLPLLKKEHLQEALYGLCEVGVYAIQLMHVHKAHVKIWSPKDHEKAEKTLIAAAEQSKNFTYPLLLQPIALEIAVAQSEGRHVKIMLDAQGESIFSLHENIEKEESVSLFVGPEADFSDKEKELLLKSGVTSCKLTQTILRAYQAAIVGAAFWIMD